MSAPSVSTLRPGDRLVALRNLPSAMGLRDIAIHSGTELIYLGPSSNALHPLSVCITYEDGKRWAVSEREVRRSGYPDEPGFKEQSGTSEEAAKSMEPTAAMLRDRVLASLVDLEGTSDEVAERLGLTVLSVRPRFSELFKDGVIAKTGRRGKNSSGRMAHVWSVVNAEAYQIP